MRCEAAHLGARGVTLARFRSDRRYCSALIDCVSTGLGTFLR